MKTFAGLAAVVLLALGAAACGDGGSAAVAKVGSQPITKKQLDAVLLYDRGQYRKMHFTFPRPGSAEYVLLRQQAVDFLVEQSRAHQADATIGVKPSNQVVSDAAFRKVTAKVHVTDADVRSSFRTHPTGRPLDRATASDIRRLLLKQRRATIMHGFVGAARRDYPVTYEPGYRPVAAWTLAKRIWTVHVVSKVCDLPPGMHPYLQAVAHSCASQTGPFIVSGEKPCPLIDQPGGLNGFTSAMEDDGFADYATSNAGTCAGGPRGITVDITAQENRTPVMVSYLPGRGSTRLVDSNFGVTLNHPRRLHVLRVDKIGQGAESIEIANFALSALSTGRTLPPNGIDVSLLVPYGGTGAFKGPNPHDSIFPLSLARYRPLVGKSTMFGVQADGASYTVTIREGARPSTADQAAVQEIITSIRFQPARPGTFTNGYYVLGPAARYPLGSVAQVAAGIELPWSRPGHVQRSGRFYLEHTRAGFSIVTWPNNDPRGYKACGPRFDPSRRRFTCPNGAVWDLQGRVVRNPDPAVHPDDQLQLSGAVVSFDGYVLVQLPPAP